MNKFIEMEQKMKKCLAFMETVNFVGSEDTLRDLENRIDDVEDQLTDLYNEDYITEQDAIRIFDDYEPDYYDIIEEIKKDGEVITRDKLTEVFEDAIMTI